MNITGAIFDMDGTLIDSLGFWDFLWETLGEKYLGDKSFRPDAVTEKAVRTVTLYDGMCIVHNNCKIAESSEALFAVAEEMLKNFYEEKVEMKPGALEFLKYLKQRGVKMCIASATVPHLIGTIMDKFDLHRFFKRVFSCNDVGKGKEHPDVFIEAHRYLKTPKESTFIFEDSIVALETATKAGYHTVGVYDRFNFALDKVKKISTVYIDKGESLTKIIPEIE